MSRERSQESSGLSIGTLVVASLSSLVAALVVSQVWGGGTLIGAAITPVIVALVSEALHRPARAVSSVRRGRAASFDPVAEGQRGMREGDLSRARRPTPAEAAERRVHRPRSRQRLALRLPRRRVALAVVTGIMAFALAGVMLTSGELVFGDSSVGSSSKRTTFLGGASKSDETRDEEERTTTVEKTTTTTVPATTEEAAPEATTPTAPPATAPAPGAAPTTPAPAPQAAPPATTPAPQGGTPAPPATTP